MGSQENRAKSQKTAEYMKAKGVRRTTQQCVWGCGAAIPINRDGALMEHLSRCQGGGARRGRPGSQKRRKR